MLLRKVHFLNFIYLLALYGQIMQQKMEFEKLLNHYIKQHFRFITYIHRMKSCIFQINLLIRNKCFYGQTFKEYLIIHSIMNIQDYNDHQNLNRQNLIFHFQVKKLELNIRSLIYINIHLNFQECLNLQIIIIHLVKFLLVITIHFKCL